MIKDMLFIKKIVGKVKKPLPVILCAFFFVNSPVKAQDLKQELIGIYKKFDQYDFKMDLQMEIMYWDERAKQTTKGSVKKRKTSYYTDFNEQINLINEKYQVLVVKPEQQIIYGQLTADKQTQVRENALNMMSDTTLMKNIKLLKKTAQFQEYGLTINKGGIETMTLQIADNVLQKVNYYYAKSEMNPIKEVEIVYNNVQFNPSFTANDFSEKVFFKQINGKEVLTPAYKNYSITKANL